MQVDFLKKYRQFSFVVLTFKCFFTWVLAAAAAEEDEEEVEDDVAGLLLLDLDEAKPEKFEEKRLWFNKLCRWKQDRNT